MRTLKLLSSLFLMLTTNNLGMLAQYKHVTTSSMPEQIKIEQIDYNENSTVVSMSCVSQEGKTWMNIDDGTFAQTADGKRYPMTNSINLPINTEAEYRQMEFNHAGQKHHFALVFAPMPKGEKFDIIENEDKYGGLNIHDIAVDTAQYCDKINIDEFIRDYPIKETGRFIKDNVDVSYIKSNGITLTTCVQAKKQYGKYYIVSMNLINQTGKSVLLNMDNITAEGDVTDEYGNTKAVQLQVLDSKTYDKVVKKKQNWNNFWFGVGENIAASSAGYTSSYSNYSGSSLTTDYTYGYGSTYTSTYGQIYTQSYNAAAAYAAQQQANTNTNAYANNQAKIREELNAGYIKNNTIQNGVEYSGFFNIKYKKVDQLRIRFMINGEPFSFTY